MAVDLTYAWGETFQLRLLAYLIKEPEKIYDVVEPNFFTSPIFREISRVVKGALKGSKSAQLDRSTLIELLRPSVGEEDSWSLYKKTVKRVFKLQLGDREILYNEAFEFARESRYREALEQSERDITSKHYERVHNRMEQLRGFGKDVDLGLEYWSGLTRRGVKRRWTEDRYAIVGTKLSRLDKMMGGGLGAGELAIVLAGGKVGKTTFLANVAAGGMWQMKTVALATAELAAKKYRKRIDSLIVSKPTNKLHLRKYRKRVLRKLLRARRMMKGNLWIKQFPTGKATVGDIETWLANLQAADVRVDMLIVDYLFLFQPNTKTRDRRINIGQVAVELRGIAMERDIPVWTASQGNRAALSKTVLGPQDFAEDISQFWTLDFLVALCQSKHEGESKPEKARVVLASARDVGSGGIDKLFIDRKTGKIVEGDWAKEDVKSSSDDVEAEDKKKHIDHLPGSSD